MGEVSVVIPTRDRPDMLGMALRCALGQQDVEVEVIVVDDASSPPAAAALETPTGANLRWLRHDTPRGRSSARNAGIEVATGDWIAFLDDDDVWAPDKLRAQLAAADADGADWVYAGDVVTDERLHLLAGRPPRSPAEVVAKIGSFNPVPSGASNVCVRRRSLADVGGFDPDLHATEDWDLWLRLARRSTPVVVPRPLVGYRMRLGRRRVDVDAMVREPRILARRHGIAVDQVAMIRRAAWSALQAGQRGQAARWYLRAALRGDARSLARAAVAVAHPAVGRAAPFELLPPGDPEWEAAARTWLEPLAAAAAGDTPWA
jgi:glycosyltransferase involved in cell wall biosynthesis